MVWIAVLVGGVLGLAIGDDGEFGLIGAVLGWLVARSVRQHNEIAALRKLVEERPVVAAAEQAVAPAAPVTAAEPIPSTPAAETAPAAAMPPSLAAPSAAAAVPAPAMAADAPRAPSAAPARPAPAMPGALSALRNWLFGGNTIVKAGIGILFVGLAFLAKYATEHVQVAVEWRLSAIAAVAIALLVVGWRLRERRAGYAQVLQGGAVAVLYLVLFAAFRFYGVIAAGPAFALMACVAAFSAALAVLQDARALAVVGALGGFATPLLVSTGSGNFVALFSYYLVLDFGIAVVAWHRTWRSLEPDRLPGDVHRRHRVGRAALPAAGLCRQPGVPDRVLPALRRHPADAVAARRHRRAAARAPHRRLGRRLAAVRPADHRLCAAVGLVRQWPYAVAGSALVLAAFYVALAAWMRSRAGDAWARFALAFEGTLGVAVVFLTLVIPFALDASATAGAWALEGAGLVWIGLRQSRRLARASGYALIVLAGAALWHGHPGAARPMLFDGFTLGALMVVAGALFAALQVQRRLASAAAPRFEAHAELLLIAWSVWWLLAAAQWQIGGLVESRFALAAWIASLSLFALLYVALAPSCRWPKAALPAMLHAPALALFVLGIGLDGKAPFANGGWWAWAIALAVHLLVLRRRRAAVAGTRRGDDGACARRDRARRCRRAAVACLDRRLGRYRRRLGLARLGHVPGIAARRAAALRSERLWPVAAEPRAYQQLAGGVLAGGLVLWTLLANWSSNGGSAPLPHVPLLNPLDLGIAIALLAAARWALRHAPPSWLGRGGVSWPQVVLGVAAFVWINAMLIRAFHHYGDVPYRLSAWTHSLAVQSGIALLWSATALALMWRSARRGERAPWLVGAALLAAVVLKLLLVDLSGTGTVTRIVSFIGVGVLMLVIGYVAPLPARRAASSSDDEALADAPR